MTTLSQSYAGETAARRAVAALGAEGLADIRMVTGARWHDVREEPVGGFAGTLSPDAPVGTFANVTRKRHQGTGAFAGSADRQRQGSFADADRDVVVTCDHATEHSRVTGDHGLRRLLRDAHLPGAAADRVVADVHAGRTVVLAERSDSQARPEDLGHAA